MTEDRYEIGYRDGESSNQADYAFAMHDGPAELPDSFDVTPSSLSELFAALHAENKLLEDLTMVDVCHCSCEPCQRTHPVLLA